MHDDDLDVWLSGQRQEGPLVKAMEALLDEGLAVQDAVVEDVTRRAQRRLPRRRRRWPIAVGVALAAAAAGLMVRGWTPQDPEVSWAVDPSAAQLDPVRAEAATVNPSDRAARWLQEGHARDAELLYRLLLAQRPTGPAAAAQQLGLIEALRQQQDEAGAFAATMELVERYGPGTPWHDRFGDDALGTELSRALRRAAVDAHARGKAEEDPAILDRAGVAYELYLSDALEPEQEGPVRYAYGELLYKRERFDEAFEQYRAVAEDHPDSAQAEFCAQSAVYAAEKMVEASEGDPVWGERMVQAADAYVDRYGDTRQGFAFRYRAAYQVFQSDPSSSVERFDAVVRADPDSAEAAFGARLAVDALMAAEDHETIAERVAEWLDLGVAQGREQRAELETMGAWAAYQLAVSAVAEGEDPETVWAAYQEDWPGGQPPP